MTQNSDSALAEAFPAADAGVQPFGSRVLVQIRSARQKSAGAINYMASVTGKQYSWLRKLYIVSRQGWKMPEEAKEKIRRANKGRFFAFMSLAGRKAVSESGKRRKGVKLKPHSEEAKAKMRAARIGRKFSASAGAKMSLAQRSKEYRVSEETKAKMSASAKLRAPRVWTEDQKAKLSETRKAMFSNPKC